MNCLWLLVHYVRSCLYPPMVHCKVSLLCTHHLHPPWRGAMYASVCLPKISPKGNMPFISLCTLCLTFHSKLPSMYSKGLMRHPGFLHVHFFSCLDIVQLFSYSTVILIHVDFLTNFPIQTVLRIHFYKKEH